MQVQADEEALINLRYMLADAMEICRGMSSPARSEVVVIEQMINLATQQIMMLLESSLGTTAGLLSSAA